jgi:hypothetical protein
MIIEQIWLNFELQYFQKISNLFFGPFAADVEKLVLQSESKLINGVAGKTTGHVILIWKRWHVRRSWKL